MQTVQIVYSDSYLAHHGILGQKWGVRRYQNPDGSLTDAGRKRYGSERQYNAYQNKKQAQKAFNKAYNKYEMFPSKVNYEQLQETSVKLNAAKKEYNFSRAMDKTTQKERDDFRAEAIKKYASKNPKVAAKYASMSEDELAADIMHKQKAKTILKVAAGTIGVSAALYLAYKVSLADRLSEVKITGSDDLSKVLNALSYDAKRDVGFILDKGSEIHRQVGYDDFDLSKVTEPIYATFKKNDTNVYKALLADWNHTGQRYDVMFKAATDIKIAGKQDISKVIDRMIQGNPNLIKDLENEIRDTIAAGAAKKAGHVTPNALDIFAANAGTRQIMGKTKEYAMLYNVVGKGKVKDQFVNELKQMGFGGVVDLHDIDDKLTKLPIILLDPQKDLNFAGQTKVEVGDKIEALKEISKDVSHPQYLNARMLISGGETYLKTILK